MSVSHHMVTDPEAATKMILAKRLAFVAAPPISARSALTLAAIHIRENGDPAQILALTDPPEGPAQRQNFSAAFVRRQAIVELIWLPTDASTLRLCWRVTLAGRTIDETLWVFTDAETGAVWLRRSLSGHASPATYKI